jgi:hypothetical protein
VLPSRPGRPCRETPPLSDWAGALAARLFGDSSGELRLPNVLYALMLALAMGALGYALDGAVPAVVAALVAGSAITAFRVSLWLAPDACLLAACAVAGLGASLGYPAAPGRRKLCGPLLVHAGAAAGFRAKSAGGSRVRGLTRLTVIAWERRSSEVKRGERYARFLPRALIIGPWRIAMSRTARGAHAPRVMFGYNLAGRFMTIAAPPAYPPTGAHRNTFGKYCVQLPVYRLPWPALAAVAGAAGPGGHGAGYRRGAGSPRLQPAHRPVAQRIRAACGDAARGAALDPRGGRNHRHRVRGARHHARGDPAAHTGRDGLRPGARRSSAPRHCRRPSRPHQPLALLNPDETSAAAPAVIRWFAAHGPPRPRPRAAARPRCRSVHPAVATHGLAVPAGGG